MAVVMAEPFYVLGTKLSVGAFDQGIFQVDEPDVQLDIWGRTRFRGGVDLTDASFNFGGTGSTSGGNGAVAFGDHNSALGYNALVQGRDSTATGNNSIAVGRGLVAPNPDQAAFGRWNTNESTALLIVGDGLDANRRSDALRVYRSGNVFANALTTNCGINLLDPLYTGPLIQSRCMDGSARGIGIDANTTVLSGPRVQLALSSPGGSVSPQVTLATSGAVVNTDCVFYGNVTFAGQTISTVTSTVECSDPILTIAHDYAPLAKGAPYDLGLMGERPTGNTGVIWDESANTWAFVHTQANTQSGNLQLSNFTYANLRTGGTVVDDLTVQGQFTMDGDLTLRGDTVMNNAVISNTFEVAGFGRFDRQLTVEGPSVLNTVFVANQVVLNNGIFPSKPDAWPVGQVDNRFSRAYLDTVDVYDSLQLSGGVQDTQPARVGAFGEANVYLYTTSPFYQDTVGIYFDKGQSLYPQGKSAIVQRYDQWALRTMGIDRLTANTVTGNLRVANELVVASNLVAYGPQSVVAGNLRVLGTVVANGVQATGATVFGGNLLPSTPDVLSIGLPGQRFANAYLDTLDVYQMAPGGGQATVNIGSGGTSNVYLYSNASPGGQVSVTLDAGTSRSGLVQSGSTLSLVGTGGTILTANAFTSNVVLWGDGLVLGNSGVVGTLGAQGNLVVGGALLANTGLFGSTLTVGNVIPSAANVWTLGNGASRFRTAYLDVADLYDNVGPLRVGSALSTNVYVYTDSTDPSQNVSVTLSTAAGAAAFLQTGGQTTTIGAGGKPRLLLDNARGNLTVLNDALFAGNLAVGPLQCANLTGNVSSWAGQATFQGPLLPGNPSVVLGQVGSRFQSAYLNRVDLYDPTCPLRAGAPGPANVVLYSNSAVSPVSLFLSQGANTGALVQGANSLALFTQGVARLALDSQTGNVTMSSDVQGYGNLSVYGQTASFQRDLQVLGHLAANNAFVGGPTVVDGSVTTLTPNVWTLGAPGNRFSTAYLNAANLYNQSGAAQRIGSAQTANVGIFTDSALAGQTATLFFDKAGVARTSLTQDATGFSLLQQGVAVAAFPNATGNLVLAADAVVPGNLVAYGQTAVSDLTTRGRVLANTLYVAGGTTLAGNLLPAGAVAVGAASNRMQAVYAQYADLSGPAPQLSVAGAASANLSLASVTGDSTLSLVGPAGSTGTVTQDARGLLLSTQAVPRLTVSNATGNVVVANSLTVLANAQVLGQVLKVAGNLGVQGGQARWPLDFNGYASEKTVGMGGTGWLGGNGVTQDLAYQAVQSHRFYGAAGPTTSGAPVLLLSPNANVTVYGNLQPSGDLQTDLGLASARWRQLVAGNVYASQDSCFNGAVVGALGSTGIGLASNAQPANAYAVLQYQTGNTHVNSAASGAVKLSSGNVVGGTYLQGRLRLGDGLAPRRGLEVVQDAAVGGVLSIAQTAGYLSDPSLLTPTATGWLQLGNLTTVGNGAQMRLSLLGQAGLGNVATAGGQTDIFVATPAQGQPASGSWSSVGFQPLLSNVKLLQTAANAYTLYASRAANNVSYSVSAALTNATFSHACLPAADPGPNATVLQQQIILNGFSIYGNSTGVLSNAIGGQPWLLNGNSIMYNAYANVGIGTQYPSANLDVRGDFNFTGQLLSNGKPIAIAQVVSVANAYVSPAADAKLLAANLGLAYPSSFRVGDYNAPTGVLEVVQGGTTAKFGGANGLSSDISTTANAMCFNVANLSPSWTFSRLGSYANLATKTTVATIAPDGSYVQASDARLKRGVRDLDTDDCIARLASLRPKRYVTQGDSRVKYGLIAQEVQRVMPELVHSDADGMLSVNYTGLVPLLLQTVQSLLMSRSP